MIDYVPELKGSGDLAGSMPDRKCQAPAGLRYIPGVRLLALWMLIGCTPGVYYSMSHRGDVEPTPPVIPARVDVDASEVVLDVEGFGGGLSGDEVRRDVANAMQEYFAGGPKAPAARFQLVGRTSVSGAAIMWLFPCFVNFVLVGCPLNVQSAHVELTVQVGDRQFRGAGEGFALGGLYYTHNTQGALGRATAHALQQVFENARAEK